MSVHHNVYCQFRNFKIPLPLIECHGKFINTIPMRNKNSHSPPAYIYMYWEHQMMKKCKEREKERLCENGCTIFKQFVGQFFFLGFFFYLSCFFPFIKLLRHSPHCRKQLYGRCLVVNENHYTYLSKLIGQDKWLWGAMCHFLQTTGVENSLGDNRFQK